MFAIIAGILCELHFRKKFSFPQVNFFFSHSFYLEPAYKVPMVIGNILVHFGHTTAVYIYMYSSNIKQLINSFINLDELCTHEIFTTEFVEGISMEQCMELDQETRNYVAEKILVLCLTELFSFRFMQTVKSLSFFFLLFLDWLMVICGNV